MIRTALIAAAVALSLAAPAAAQRVGQPFPAGPREPGLRFPGEFARPAPMRRRLLGARGLRPVAGRLGRAGFRGRFGPAGVAVRVRKRAHPRRRARGPSRRSRRSAAAIVFVSRERGYGYAAGPGDEYYAATSPEERPEGGTLPTGPATGAYAASPDAVETAALPGRCAEVTVLLAGGGSYAAAVELPTLGADTPARLQSALRDAHRRGRFVRLRGPGGLGVMIPAGPGVRDVRAGECPDG